MYGYIYLTTNTVNNKKYIGQHKGEFTTEYLGSGKVLKQALSKYGKENFTVIMLDTANSKEELDSLEKKYIEEYNALYEDGFYNIHEGGTGGNTKHGYSFEEYNNNISKESKSHKGNKFGVNKSKDKDNNSMYNKHHSELSKLKISNKVTRHGTYQRDRLFKDIVLSSSDEDVLKKAFSRNNGASNSSSVTYKLTNVESGREILLGSKSCLSKFLGLSPRQIDRIVKIGYYSPYNIKALGKTKDISYVASYSLRRLDNIIRYNNRMKCHTQTVAAHSYYVSYTMLRLLEIVDLPHDIKYKLLSYCLIHDAAEIHIGDMPHDVKAANPELKDMLERFEDDFFIQSGLSGIASIIKDDYQKIKYNLFKLCDLMDVFMYAKEEIYLGNQTLEMSNILSQAVEDCNTIVRALKFYKVIPNNFNFIKFLDEIYEVKVIVDLKEDAYKYTTDEMEDSKLKENK